MDTRDIVVRMVEEADYLASKNDRFLDKAEDLLRGAAKEIKSLRGKLGIANHAAALADLKGVHPG